MNIFKTFSINRRRQFFKNVRRSFSWYTAYTGRQLRPNNRQAVFLRIYADAADPLGSIVNTGRQLRLKKYAGSFLRMYGDPLVGI